VVGKRCVAVLLGLVLTAPAPVAAEAPLTVLGDSIGEGVQSADASFRTQPSGYASLLARELGASLRLPLIVSGPLGVVGETRLRFRLLPFVRSANLAVSGADVGSVLRGRADARSTDGVDSETDLVLFPRRGSQIEIAESMAAPLAVCWVGNNDVLGAALTFDRLDGSQMTPVQAFERDFAELTARLDAASAQVVLANVPDVTEIGFLLDREDLVRFLGADFGLPQGDLTSIVVMFLIRLGLDDGSLVRNPDFVLDAEEQARIRDRVRAFNRIIEAQAAAIGAPVVNVHGLFERAAADPPVVAGVEVTPRYLGGLFSLDGVHPSNFAHALLADAFIATMNAELGSDIALIARTELRRIFLTDPFVDKDGDGRVPGRPLAGLLETLGPVLGVSGDLDDTFQEGPAEPRAEALQRLRELGREGVMALFRRALAGSFYAADASP